MARIPGADLDRLKREVDLIALVEASGVKLQRQGQDWVGLCPNHEDREPSLIVSPKKRPPLWHCLGACDQGGTAVDWVMKRDGVSFLEAVARLQQMVGGSPIASATEPPETSLPADDLVLDDLMDDRQIWDATVAYYHQVLLDTPAALDYLERRGLSSPALHTHFEIGYCDRTLGRHIPPRQTKPGQRFRARLMDLGIMRKGSGQEHMSGRVVLPVRDESGLVVGMYGHTTHTKLHADVTPKHFYLPGPRRGVLNWKCLLEHKEVILCESPFDALTFWAAGFRNVTSSWGCNGFSAKHLATLLGHGVERVLIAYDRDDAGDKGAAKVAEQLLGNGVECFRVLLPRGMDVNEYALKVQPAEKSLSLVIRQAQWMGKGRPPTALISSATAKDPQSPLTLGEIETRAAAEEELASSLAAVSASGPKSPAASPAPPAPAADVPYEMRGDEVVIWLGDRRYRVRGLDKNLSAEVLKVNLLASRNDAFFVDTLDLFSARQRLPFIKHGAQELGVAEEVLRQDLQRVILALDRLQAEMIARALETEPAGPPPMTPEEEAEALSLAKDPRLIERILEDCERCGLVNERTNALVTYLAAVSSKLDKPIAVIIQSSSAAGKSALMTVILAFFPEEGRVQYSALTGQSLYYMSEQDLRHKVLAIAEEEGAERAAYALKLLLSEGELTIASTGKDPQSGRLVTHEYRVEGPVAAIMTTTSTEIDEELQNRAIVLAVDESRAQTRAIHAQQREEETLEGFWAKEERKAILARHRNLHRLIRPLVVINPYVRELGYQNGQTRTRRDHKKYLTLIRAIALLHQHQRTIRRESRNGREVEVLEVAPADVELANRLAHEVLGRSLDDLPPQTRRLLELLHARVIEECQELGIEQGALLFLMREARAWTGFGQTQLKLHMARLVDLEYVVMHRGGRGQTFVYELVYAGEGEGGARFVPGLNDLSARSTGYRSGQNGHRPGLEAKQPGSNRPRIAPESGGGRVGNSGDNSLSVSRLNGEKMESLQKTHIGGSRENAADRRKPASRVASPPPEAESPATASEANGRAG